jgi:4-amino-4-deoxy-L-arabinose transferase-like glycosyltransferase
VNKAYHIDDTLFLYAARHIQQDPVNFYNFWVNWYGAASPMWVTMQNPPLASYYIAVVASLFGWGEPALHLAFLLPAVGAVWGTYRLAQEFCTRPVLAALATLLTPAFLVSSTNVMCDTLTLCLWVWAVVLWDRGLRRRQMAYLYLSGVLICGAALSKYIGVAQVPLLLVYTYAFFRGRDRRGSLARTLAWSQALIVPILVLAFYQWATATMYPDPGGGRGPGFLFQAVGYAASVRDVPGGPSARLGARVREVMVSVSYLGGAVPGVLFFLPLLWSRRVVLAGLAVFAVLTLSAPGWLPGIPSRPDGSIPWLGVCQFGLFVAAGWALLALACEDLWTRRDAQSLLLALWVGGIFVFATFLNWTINVRSVLPLVPAVGILIGRRLDQRFGPAGAARPAWLVWPLVPAGVLALLVTWADYQMAGTARAAAAEIAERCKQHPGRAWYQGHWGFQYYMSEAGVEPLDYSDYRRRPGDLVIFPGNNCNVDWGIPRGPWVDPPYFELEVQACPWLATMNPSLGAGFYAAVFGPMPYAFGEVPPTRYQVRELAPLPAPKTGTPSGGTG